MYSGGYRLGMSNSGPGSPTGITLKIVVPYATVLRVLRELDHSDPRQRAVADELYDALPEVILARVEVEREMRP